MLWSGRRARLRGAFVTMLAGTVVATTGVAAEAATGAVTKASPATAANAGTARLTFTTEHAHVAAATTVSITGPGGTITGTNVEATATTVSALFDLDLAAPGGYVARVTDAAFDDRCATACFTVEADQPTIRSVAPAVVGVGVGALPFAVTGTEYARGATVTFYRDGVPDPKVYVPSPGSPAPAVTATQVTGTIAVAMDALTGPRDVRVTNTDGQRDECLGCLVVTAPPRPGRLAPNRAGQGATGLRVEVGGTGFVPGLTASFSGTGLTVAGVAVHDATSATVTVDVASGATAGERDLVLTNPDGGSTLTNGALTVTPAPTVSSLAPATLAGGARDETVVVTGTHLDGGATVAIPGVDVTHVTPVDATTAHLTVAVPPDAATGVRDVLVTNDDSGTSVATGAFTVAAAPVITGISPPTLGRGAFGESVTIHGANFDADGVQVTIPGVHVADVSRVDATTITARLRVDPTAAVGPRDVSVLGAVDRGRATCAACFAVDSFAFDDVSPASVNNAGSHTVRVDGIALPRGAHLTGRLVRIPAVPGQPPVVADGVVDDAGTAFTAAFDLTDVAPGNYRPVVSGDGESGTCTCLLAVTAAAAPEVTGTTPAAVPQGTLGRVVTIRGSGFTRGTEVAFGTGVLKAGGVTFLDATRLSVAVDVDPVAPVGPVEITVTVPGATDPATFTCPDCLAFAARPMPAVLSIATRGQGAPNVPVAVGGDGFRPDIVAALSGDGVTVTGSVYVSPQTMRFEVAVAPTATPGVRTLTLTNADGGTGSCACFTVAAGPKPLVVTPGAAGVGTEEVPVVVTGGDFQNGATFAIDGVPVTSSRMSSERIEGTADLTDATVGTHAVTVVNPDDGGTATCDCAFVVDAVPAVTGVTPDRRGAGALEFTLTITGTDFSAAAVPSFADPLVTVTRFTVASPTRIDAFVAIDPDAEPASPELTVRNADTGQSGSCTCFLVTPGPAMSSVAPSGRSIGAADTEVEIFGTGFAGSTLDLGAGVTVTDAVVTATRIVARVAVAADAMPGVRTVTIVNADGGRGTCACFAVTAPPVIDAIDVTRAERGADLTVRVTGAAFQNAAALSFGDGVAVSEVVRENAETLTARLTVGPGADLGPRDVTVDNGDGGTDACAGCFRVLSAPTVTGVAPEVRGRGAVTTTLTVTGTSFDDGAEVTFPTGVTAGPTTYVDATTLRVELAVASDATLGAQAVTVTNGDGGDGTCTTCFRVTPAPFVTSISPSVIQRNRTGIVATVTGGNFVKGPVEVSLGDGIVVTSAVATTDSSVTVTYDVGPFASIDRHPVTVVNPDGGRGTCAVCFVVTSPRILTVDAGPAPVSGEAQSFTVTAHVSSSPSSPVDTTYTGTPVVAVADDTHATAGSCTAAVRGVSTCSGFVHGDLGRALLNAAAGGADADLGGTGKVEVQPTGLEFSPAPPATGGLGRLVHLTVRPTVGVAGASIERYDALRTLVVEGTGANPASGSLLGCDGPVCTFSTVFTRGGVKTVRVVDDSTPARSTPAVTVTIPFPTKVTLAARPATVAGGKQATVSGRLVNVETGAGVGGMPVRIHGRVYPSTSYRVLRTVRTASDGTWRTAFTMNAHTVFYATYPGGSAYQRATSAKSLVVVTTTVTRTSPATGTTLAFGRDLVVTGRTGPRQPGSLVYLIERYPNGRLAALAQTRVARDGTFRLVRQRPARGTHTLYVQVAGTSYTSGGVSTRFTVRVT